jgi:hypothetical protein
MSDVEIAEFQRRRSAWLRRAIPFFALFFVGAIIGIGTSIYEIGFYIGLISFAGWTYFTWRLYRCPRCNAVPGIGENIALNPKFCGNCGAQLRASI